MAFHFRSSSGGDNKKLKDLKDEALSCSVEAVQLIISHLHLLAQKVKIHVCYISLWVGKLNRLASYTYFLKK